MSFLLLLLKFIFALYVSKVLKMRKKETNEINSALNKNNYLSQVSILWFRNGLRFHDNESLAAASSDPSTKLLPLFIFDGETPTTK